MAAQLGRSVARLPAWPPGFCVAKCAAPEEVLTRLDAQQHRRFIKTHSPADCVPIFEECKYVVVYRDGRDALMSWANHRGAMRPEFVEVMNRERRRGGPPSSAGVGWRHGRTVRHMVQRLFTDHAPTASWWPLRHESFAYFVHYNDLKTDLEGEMRRLATFLGIEVPDDLWPETIARCGLSAERVRRLVAADASTCCSRTAPTRSSTREPTVGGVTC